MSAATREPVLRIGEVAERAGTTTRTVRYYEEIGLLPGSQARARGQHRAYTEADVERLSQIVRLKELLGLTLDELKQLLEAEDARADLRAQWERATGDDADAATRRRILEQALGYVGRQLDLVRRRQGELDRLAAELEERHTTVTARLRELGD